MSNNLQFGAELALTGQQTAVDTAAKVAALKAAMLDLAQSYAREEISQEEFAAALKSLNSDLRTNEAALKILNAAIRDEAIATARANTEAAEAAAAADRAAAEAAEEWAAGQRQAAEAAREVSAARKQGTAGPALDVAAIERAAAAEEAFRLELAAVDREVIRIVATQEQLIASDAQLATASVQDAAAIAQKIAAEDAELRAIERAIAAHNAWQAEQEQLAAEAGKAANAIWAEDRALEAFTADVSAATSAQGRLGGALGGTRAGMSTLNMQIQAGSFAFQDFVSTSGDVGQKLNSITNNLPTLLLGLGGLGTVISVAATAGVALYRNWDTLAGFWETRNPFPKAADDIDGLKRELDRAKDSLEKMEAAAKGNAAQLEEYNRLRTRTAELEREIADQQERQRDLKRLLEAPGEEQEGRAKGFQEAVKGRGPQTLATLTDALRQDQEDYIRQQRLVTENAIFDIRQSGKTDEEKARLVAGEWQRFESLVNGLRSAQNRPEKLAEDLMIRLSRGEESAFRQLDRLTRETTVMFGDLVARIDQANPVLKRKVDEFWKGIEDEVDADIHAFKKERAAGEKMAREFWASLGQEVAEYIKEVKKEGRAQKAADATEAKADTKEENDARKAERKKFEQTGVAAQAAAIYSQARAQGATADQAFDFTTQQALQFLNRPVGRDRRGRVVRANAGMSEEQTNLLATRIASQGRRGFQDEIATAQAQGVTGVEATQQAMAATQEALARVMARLAKVEGNARRLQQNGARLARRADEQGPTALLNGGPN